jgi:uncharacterized protein (DUF58 family)
MNPRRMADSGSAGGPGAERADLLDPQSLASLGGLELVATRVVEGLYSGLHRSPHRGFSVEFAEHRMYQPGDDLRFVDWRMFGRSDRYYVKQFEQETSLRATILLDVSRSMDWSSSPELPTKLWYARQLAAALALLLVRQGDSVGLTAFDDAVRHRLEPGGGDQHWRTLVQGLEGLSPGSRTDLATPLTETAARMRARGLAILISDLLADTAEVHLALRRLRHQGHEVLVFHLVDPGERELPSVAGARFIDPETGEEVTASVPEVRNAYRRAVEEALAEWGRTLRGGGMDYHVVDTDRPMAPALRHYLRRRARV